MEHKQQTKAASRAAFLLAHSPAHQPFNKDGKIKINRTGKKKKPAAVRLLETVFGLE